MASPNANPRMSLDLQLQIQIQAQLRSFLVPIPRPFPSAPIAVPNAAVLNASTVMTMGPALPPPNPSTALIPYAPPVTAGGHNTRTASVSSIASETGGQCRICAESPTSTVLLCGHSACNNCLRSWIDSKVIDGAGSDGKPPVIRCPFPECRVNLADSEILACLKLFPESLESYHKLSIIRALSNQPDFFPCPAPKCGGGGFWTDDLDCSPKSPTDNERRLDVIGGEKRPSALRTVRKGKVECPHCAASWSLSPQLEQQARTSRVKLFARRVLSKLRCCRRFLPQAPAEYNAEQLLWSESNRLAADANTTMFKSKFTQECPKCHVRILKEGGCSHMTCGKCHFSFTWTKSEATPLPVPPPPGSLASRYFPGLYMSWQRVDQRIKNALGIMIALTIAATVLSVIGYLGYKLFSVYLIPFFTRSVEQNPRTAINVAIAMGIILRLMTIAIAVRFRKNKLPLRMVSFIDFACVVAFWMEQPVLKESPAFLSYVYSTFTLLAVASATVLILKRRAAMNYLWDSIPYKLRERLRAKGSR